MRLHENETLFRQAVQFTADQLSIPAIYVEKDYWVTYVLHVIFNNALGKDTVFKGGTALSKCYQLIDRFSEDIDLVVIRRDGETDNNLKSKIRNLSKLIDPMLPEVEIPDVTNKKGMNRKTAHSYSKVFKGNYGQVRDVIVLESTWLGYYEPFTRRRVDSYMGEMMRSNGQIELAMEYGLVPFEINVLEPKRTLCEKIMSLVRFSYSENPMEDLKKKIRHTYDLHQLIQQKEYSAFLDSPEFDTLLLRVAMEDVVSFRNNNRWLSFHPVEALVFAKLEIVWEEMKPVYQDEFKNLVFGKLPQSDEVFHSLALIKERLSRVKWNVEI